MKKERQTMLLNLTSVLITAFLFSCSIKNEHGATGFKEGEISGSNKQITFRSSDENLKKAFNWAKGQAYQHVGSNSDVVGPWYEAALPNRFAFCMRDVSHQSI